jgi:Rnl2 family RNA ligase
MFDLIKDKDSISVYGELFGGFYPHDEVEKVKGLSAIQTGVYYSPKIEFCAFDIQVSKGKEMKYLDFEDSLKLFKACGIFHSEPLFIGKYEQAIEYPVSYQSTIPSKLKLPTLKENQAEGIVVKPMKTLYCENLKGVKTRIILKFKPKEFKEDKKYLEAEKWKETKEYEMTNLYDLFFNEIHSLITTQRLENAISKIGLINTKKKAEELLKLFMEDVCISVEDNLKKEFKELKSEENEELMTYLKKESTKLIKNYFI